MRHPLVPGPLPAERAAAVFRHLPDAPLEPAPRAGQHTRDIARTLLGLSHAQVEELTADGVLEGRRWRP